MIDGLLDDQAWEQSDWSAKFVDIEGFDKPEPQFLTRMKMCWDDQYLFIAAELEEPQLQASLKNRDDIIYRDNDFEVFIDPDGDGLNYYEFEINAFGTEFDLLMNKPYKKGGKANIPWDFTGLKSAVSLQGTLNDPNDRDTSWTVEIAIPWTAFSENVNPVPQLGDTWRINFSRVQWQWEIEDRNYIKKLDKKGKKFPEDNWVWSPQGVINMHIPEKWGYVDFVENSEQKDISYPKFWAWTAEHKPKPDSYWDSTFRLMKQTGIEGVLLGAGPDILEDAARVAAKYGIEIHAWFWTMNRGDADSSWLSVNRLGKSLAEEKAYVNYYKFMCPALPEVRKYLQSKIDELTKVPGLKGVHMDYIRYVDAILPVGLQPKYGLTQDHIFPEFDYGYHDYLRKIYQAKHGIDPLELEDVENNQEWLNFRLAVLDTTVWRIKNQVRCDGLQISSAVFPSPEMSKQMVRQGWDNWKLDYFFPMVYHNFYNEDFDWIEKIMAENKMEIGNNSKVFCGLYVPALKAGNDLTSAMVSAMQGGADGISFFNWKALDKSQRDQIRSFIEKQEN